MCATLILFTFWWGSQKVRLNEPSTESFNSPDG